MALSLDEAYDLLCRCGHTLAEHLPARVAGGARPCRAKAGANAWERCHAECVDFTAAIDAAPKVRKTTKVTGERLFPV